jgi:hypothetical protein
LQEVTQSLQLLLLVGHLLLVLPVECFRDPPLPLLLVM